MSDKIGPTKEREIKSQAGSVDRVELKNDVGRTVSVIAKKYLSPLESLHGRGAIDDDEAAAGFTFYVDWYRGTQPSSIVPRYDEFIGQIHDGDGTKDAQARRSYHHNRFVKAADRIGPELEMVALHLILEQPMPGETAPPTIAELGKLISHYKRNETATAFAVGQLKVALKKLRKLYRI